MGYRVSGGISGTQRAAGPGLLPVPGSWEAWFPEQRLRVPPDLRWGDGGRGEGTTCLWEADRRTQMPGQAGFGEHGRRGIGGESKPL